MNKIFLIKWIDSCIINEQVDSDNLPSISELETVGWVSKENDDYIVISRDYSPDKDSYSWRSNLAIPRICIKDEIEIDISRRKN